MPRMREGYRQMATQVPVDVYVELEMLSRRTGRSVAEEVTQALRRHLAAPPEIRVIQGALPPDVVLKEDKPARKKPGPKRKK